VPLRRATLPPGTVYADPYGHTLIITRWIPQTLNRPGALVAADAQPDGTVGLRRFWRGSFLFHPRTQRVGAGWKAARPVRYHAASRRFEVPDNAALRDYVLPFSLQQYQGSTDDFYRRMQRVINPLPQDAERRLETLVVALHETVQRRVQAVALGDAWVQEQQEVVDLPHGARIFLTTGPWEKYSTPARDLRLLMAIDVVTGLIGQVRRHPRRFGIAPADRAAALRRLTERLSRELRRRTIRYVRSDGSPWVLTLDEVVSRQSALEMGYHPNDCVEIRWGAPPGSAERSTCDRRAPEKHRDRMEQYRPWFKKRTRPAM
jgi:hypothetical protein